MVKIVEIKHLAVQQNLKKIFTLDSSIYVEIFIHSFGGMVSGIYIYYIVARGTNFN
jgi:hypothetical protein